jgi:beta-lactam-binding protein with PASTA domain
VSGGPDRDKEPHLGRSNLPVELRNRSVEDTGQSRVHAEPDRGALTRFRTRWKRLLSRGPPSFIVTAGVVKVELDDSGAARAPFTVTNSSAQSVKGHLVTKPRRGAKPEWFKVVDEFRDFAPNAAEQVVVQLKVPSGSRPGSYRFRLDALNVDIPDEDFTEGPFVAFEVAAAPPNGKKFPWWMLILASAVLLIVIGIVVWLLVRDGGTKSQSVPAVISMSAGVADSTLTDAGFTVKTRSVPVSDPTKNGDVQSQDPAAGTAQPPGTAVTITVGRMSRVPSLKGLAETKAKTTLADADLKVAVRRVGVEDPAQSLIVLDQDPPADTLQPPGTVVTITVGPTVTVPDVRGANLAEAEYGLYNAGRPEFATPVAEPILESSLRVVTVPVESQDGIVQSQKPAPGTRVPHGSVVEIRVGIHLG